MGLREFHRIGGGDVPNLRLKSREAVLNPTGISVLKAPTPVEAARQIRAVFPAATQLHADSRTVGSASEIAIRAAGFDVIPAPTRLLPNHFRITHPDDAAGYNDSNLARLSAAFVNTTGH